MNSTMRNVVRLMKFWTFGIAVVIAAERPLVKAQTIDEEPSIEIAYENQTATLTFNGILLSADTINGPWNAITNADSPYVVDAAGAQKFYSAGPYGTNSLFSSSSLVTLKLAGPFQAYFDLAYAGMPDGINPPVREKPYFAGTVVMPGFMLPVNIRVRGNSSLQECPFPKLKFKVSREHRPGTPFADAREVKIGTHCAEGGRGTIGRLRDQIAAFREVLAYEVLALSGFVAPRVRRARIDYLDTTPSTNSTSAVGWQITREALVLEDIEVVAERLGGRALSDTETAELGPGDFDAQLSADLQLFHALIGNWDYSLGWDRRGTWNIEVLELADGTKKRFVPVAGDFDLASWVTGISRRFAPHDYHPELGDIERERLYDLEQIQQRVTPAMFVAARQRFVELRTVVESHIITAKVDEEGRANALRHVSAFYGALDAIK
jgi:hypothetical protein